MTQMHLTRPGINRQGPRPQEIVRPVHAPLGGGLLVLLHCHKFNSSINSMRFFQGRQSGKGRCFPCCLPILPSTRHTFALLMAWRYGQTQNDFILDKRQNIHIRLSQNAVHGLVLIKALELLLVLRQQQLCMDIEHMLEFLQTTLALKFYDTLNVYAQNRPSVYVQHPNN